MQGSRGEARQCVTVYIIRVSTQWAHNQRGTLAICRKFYKVYELHQEVYINSSDLGRGLRNNGARGAARRDRSLRPRPRRCCVNNVLNKISGYNGEMAKLKCVIIHLAELKVFKH
ncbi:hypothetical protein EVAR_59310_1 [Eumeta japonica]|uniref:Uncharacterized protein n=1 Tax=Eumeta variegata TaxID=151549 RepID=A0A4C1Y947_EUMVA|nr:hypothetical protein EVAR_59310_1 [Eumeta japonica]